MRWITLAAALALSGCGLFSIGSDRASPPAETDAAAAADVLAACKEEARAVVARDEAIDDDIASSSIATNVGPGAETDFALSENLAAYRGEQRYRRIVEDCMRDHGYAPPRE